MRECGGRRAAGSDDGRPVLINSQFFHLRHSAPRRSGEGGGGGVAPPQHTAAAPHPHPRPHPHSNTHASSSFFPTSLLHLTFLPAQQLLLQFKHIAHRWRLCLVGKRPLGRSPHTNAHSIERKKEKKIGNGRRRWGLIIAAVLQSQQWVLTDKSRTEDTHSRAFAQLPLLDIGLAYQGHWVRIDLVIKIPPLPSLPSLR